MASSRMARTRLASEEVDAPVSLFKNLTNQHLESFLACGEVALRPFRYFANIEDVRGDRLEGTRGMTIRPIEQMQLTTDEFFTAENTIIRSTTGRPVPITL